MTDRRTEAGMAATIGFVGSLFGFNGVGHLFAGEFEDAVRLLLGGFLLHFFNALLMGVLIGFITWPVCYIWLLYVSTAGAHQAVMTRE